VRITASRLVSHYILPPVIAAMRAEAPEISVVLIPSDSSENLLFREADIAVRMYRTEQLDIITRQIGSVAMGAFAATAYLNRRGRPERPEDLSDHDLVGFDRDDTILRGFRDMGMQATSDWFSVRCDDQAAYWALVRAGCGIGFSQAAIGAGDPLVERVLPDLPIPGLPVWLAAAQTLRRTPRIRRVWDMLEAGLAPYLS
jgi:DNA-binding transcriptional LysR family regulator